MTLSRLMVSARIVAFGFICISGMQSLSSSAQAGVVYGNLGASGTGLISGTNTDYDPAAVTPNIQALAQGFTASGSLDDRQVQSIDIGLFYDNSLTAPLTVSIYADSFGEPVASPLYTSSSVTVGTTAVYSFPFSNAVLNNWSSYWVVPEGPASWYFASSTPAPQNGSGYGYVATLQKISNVWSQAPSGFDSVSINAVPEPSSIGLMAAGTLGLGFIGLRRLSSGTRFNRSAPAAGHPPAPPDFFCALKGCSAEHAATATGHPRGFSSMKKSVRA